MGVGVDSPKAEHDLEQAPPQEPRPEQQHVTMIVSERDASAGSGLGDAQPPVVMEYQNGQDAAAETAKGNGLSLKQRAVRSSMWTMTAFAAGQVIRFVSNPVLAYLLIPADFGVVRLVGIFVTLLAALSDVGIEQAIIQNKRGDERNFLNAAWTVNVLRGVLLWLGACAIAFPVYWTYRGQPEATYLLWMIPVAGLGTLINGFNSTATYTLNRHLQMGRLTILNLLHQCVNTGAVVAIAIVWRSPWAIVAGGLIGNAFYVGCSHFLIPGYRNRFRWDPAVNRELMRFGKWIMISTLITYTANQIDQPLLGKLLDISWLGLYAIALGLVTIPREVISRLASVTLFPALARAAETDPEELRRVLRRARSLILTVTLALMLGVVLGGPLFITLFFKPAYHPAGWLTQFAAIGSWFVLLQISADRALLAMGKTKPLATSNAINLVVTVAAGLLGRWFEMKFTGNPDGIAGFLLGLAMGKLAGHQIIQYEMHRAGLPILRQDTMYSLALLALSLAGIFVPRLIPGYAGQKIWYDGIAAVSLCSVTCVWAGIRVLRGIR